MRKELSLPHQPDFLQVPSIEGKDLSDCLAQLGFEAPVDAAAESESLAAAFNRLEPARQIESTRCLLTRLLSPEREPEPSATAAERHDAGELVCVVGPVSLDLNLVFRETAGMLRLEEADLMGSGVGLKAIAAARYGVRAQFIGMARDPVMRNLFERWSKPIGDSALIDTGPSRIVPHVSVRRDDAGNAGPPVALAPRLQVQPSDGAAFLAHVDACLPKTMTPGPMHVCFNGRHTFPGLEGNCYAALLRICQSKGYRTVADLRLSMSETEMLAIFDGSPWMLKANRDEFLKLYRFLYPEVSIPLRPTADEVGHMTADVARRFCISVLAVTLGKDGAVLTVRRPRMKARIAECEPIEEVSPIGSGDAFTGTFLAQLIEHGDYDVALQYASAAGAETARLEGTRIAPRADTDLRAQAMAGNTRPVEPDDLESRSYVRDRLLEEHGYTLSGPLQRGGSSMQTFFAKRRSDGADCVIKYSDWDGVSADGIPWLLGQAVKLRTIQSEPSVPDEIKALYPKVAEIYQGRNVAYYAMEQFVGATDLARHYLESEHLSATEMYEELRAISERLLQAYARRGFERSSTEFETNLLHRAERRLDMLANRSEGQVHRRLAEGVAFYLGGLRYPDSGAFFHDLMHAEAVSINGECFPNLPQLLAVLRTNLDDIQNCIGPTHMSPLTHGDLSIRNFLKCPNGAIKIIDVRSPTRIHDVTPIATSVEYDFAKLLYSPFMELVRNDLCQVEADNTYDTAKQPAFRVEFRDDPVVSRLLELRRLLREDFLDSNVRTFLGAEHPDWRLFAELGEALNYASDAVHRLSQDPSGTHSLIYYLEAVTRLTELLRSRQFLPTSA